LHTLFQWASKLARDGKFDDFWKTSGITRPFQVSSLLDAHRTVSKGEPDRANCFWKRNATMKNLLMALVAVGFLVGCGGDTAGTKATTKTTTSTTTPGAGTTKTTTEKTDSTKTTTDKDKKTP
jgi:hypothetical protein